MRNNSTQADEAKTVGTYCSDMKTKNGPFFTALYRMQTRPSNEQCPSVCLSNAWIV